VPVAIKYLIEHNFCQICKIICNISADISVQANDETKTKTFRKETLLCHAAATNRQCKVLKHS